MMKLIMASTSIYLFIPKFPKILNFMLFNFMMISTLLYFLNIFFLNYYWFMINYMFGADYISYSLMLLTMWILNLSIYLNKISKKFSYIFIFLLLNILMTFVSLNLMIFYIFFETSLIPIILIIMGWGYQIDRIQASMYMFFYTLFGSLPLLIIILMIYQEKNSLMMNLMNLMNLKYKTMYFFIFMNMAFIIKMPMYLFHLWLPKAHVEAPISGSMILAGIMLKLGSYGLYRSMMIFPKLMNNFNKMMICICLIGSLISSLICLNQSDLKIIVAYSSVVHMSLMLASMFTLFNMSLKGSLMMMIAHGLCSSSMFYLVNLNYMRLKSRNNMINKNMLNIYPSISLWWFLVYSSNFSAPPSLNLFSEIFLLMGLIQWNLFLMSILILILFFSTCYSIFIYSFSQYGKMNFSMFMMNNIMCKEYLIIILHWLPLNMMFLNMNFMN
uniref:NADH-ubiquinone oxidoreductase chain 4 n=1 Tax=Psyttalia lounsburyi TaxID=405760 RepID=A0A8A4JBV4_9HYME|nr:NADH dehydrogenase subunit 4 [Psyttalia lounsburyi]